MENEIELKIMLKEENIPLIKKWINQQAILKQETEVLGNTYYDSPALFFAKNKMGLRVRNKNQQFELTLKMKGEIVGGLHIRPEYNLPLEKAEPDFKRLVSHFNLQIENVEQLQQELQATFSTDFMREKWLIEFKQAQIEIALDQGMIKNAFGEEPICELEFELKSGDLPTLFAFLDELPKKEGMWLSSLSKAQRGYLVGIPQKIAKEIEKLLACNIKILSDFEKYQFEQQVADFIRLDSKNELLIQLYKEMNNMSDDRDLKNYLVSQEYLIHHLEKIKSLY